MKKFTLLESDQIFYSKLNLFTNRSEKALITDLAKASGVYTSLKTKEGDYGIWWTKTPTFRESDAVDMVECDGTRGCAEIDSKTVGCRIALEFTNLEDLNIDKNINEKVIEIEYGEYPQDEVSIEEAEILDSKLRLKTLRETGKNYILDNRKSTYKEYIYNGKKYIKYIENYEERFYRNNFVEKYHWIEVKPIKWIVDIENKIALTEKILIGNIKYNEMIIYSSRKTEDYYDYEKSNIKKFIDNSFAIDMEVIKEKSNLKNQRNSYNFRLDNENQEDLIKQGLDTNLPLFLHGPNPITKDTVIKNIDSNYEVINLINANSISINGYKHNKPSWLQNLERKCMDEPEKKHIVYFEDFDKVSKTIRSNIFDIAIKRKIDDKWSIPNNAKVILSQNDVNDHNNEYSDEMNEFVHIYIKPNLNKWLMWANQNNIHPAIYTYITYAELSKDNINLNTKKWEMASKILYATNNPTLLKGLLGEEVTCDFIDFSKKDVITIDDVISNNIPEGVNIVEEKDILTTIYRLSKVEENALFKVRDFVKNISEESIKIFDELWCFGNNERKEIVEKHNQVKIKQK